MEDDEIRESMRIQAPSVLENIVDNVMSPQSPILKDIQHDGRQLRTISSLQVITEEGNQEGFHQPEHKMDDPSHPHRTSTPTT